jgi:hypothetical protein
MELAGDGVESITCSGIAPPSSGFQFKARLTVGIGRSGRRTLSRVDWTHKLAWKIDQTSQPVYEGIGIVAGTIPLLVQLGVWKEIYRSWFVFSYTGEPFFFLKPALWSSLFSDRHGLFNWHPLLLLGAIGWIIGSFRKFSFPKAWIISFALVVYINSTWWCWWFGSSFGNRSYEVSLLFFMAGLGFAYEQFKSSKTKLRILSAVAWGAILWNVLILSE